MLLSCLNFIYISCSDDNFTVMNTYIPQEKKNVMFYISVKILHKTKAIG